MCWPGWPSYDTVPLTEAFRRAVLRPFVRRGLFDEDQALGMLQWPHSGFHVHAGVGVPGTTAPSPCGWRAIVLGTPSRWSG